jgi:phosphatidylglycerophosphatase A
MKIKNLLVYGLASGFGSGYLPKAPGTWGSLVGLLIVALCGYFPRGYTALCILLGGVTVLGYLVSRIIVKENPLDLDPSFIVIDEIVGMMVAVAMPAYFMAINGFDLVILFGLFRLLDITKPLAIGWVDRRLCAQPKTAALGIMLDDILAGALAGLILLGLKAF